MGFLFHHSSSNSWHLLKTQQILSLIELRLSTTAAKLECQRSAALGCKCFWKKLNYQSFIYFVNENSGGFVWGLTQGKGYQDTANSFLTSIYWWANVSTLNVLAFHFSLQLKAPHSITIFSRVLYWKTEAVEVGAWDKGSLFLPLFAHLFTTCPLMCENKHWTLLLLYCSFKCILQRAIMSSSVRAQSLSPRLGLLNVLVLCFAWFVWQRKKNELFLSM